LREHPQVEVRRASAYDIDYEGTFDIVFSIGVVHHLEAPERALSAMVSAVKPEGSVLIWVYGMENNRWLVTVLDPLRKALFSRLPIGIVHFLSLAPASMLWTLLRAGVLRGEYFQLLRRMRLSQVHSIVFDQMLPRIAHYWSKEAVTAMMTDAGLVAVELASVNGRSWVAIGRWPSIRADAG
jgi:SAM-dependent methyltransferase